MAQPVDRRLERPDPAERVLAIVTEVAEELHGSALGTGVRLESSLERDLGLDSLARVELLNRLDRAFAIRLPDELLAEAESPRDLLAGLLGAAAAERISSAQVLRGAPGEQRERINAPQHATTLIQVLEHHAREHPERTHVVLSDGEEHERALSYGELAAASRRVAHGLLALGVRPGARIALMLPAGADFFGAFFGVLHAGCVPVPIYPPTRRSQLEEHLRRQAVILRNASAAALISFDEARPAAKLLGALVPSLRTTTTVSELSRDAHRHVELPSVRATDLALLQYTSGSTGDPKGVMLRHDNLLANVRAMSAAAAASDNDVFVSWLPLYHDMGLIGMWLTPLYLGARTVILSPLAFLARPERWLWTIHRHIASITAAPNFAFELCARKIDDAELTGLDLGSLRMMANGSEPVMPSTLRRFMERFGRYGLRPEAMAPVYGLAECSVGLAFPPLGRGLFIERVKREELSRCGCADLAGATHSSSIEFVACGRALPGHGIRIVDEQGRELPERRQGRIQFRGPSCTSGYFRNRERTRALFDGAWLESGDLGYLSAGEIFVTGRAKDIVIRAGRNVYPQQVEDAVGEIEGVRRGCVAVFGSADAASGTERLVVLAETRETRPEAREALRRRIGALTAAVLEEPADDIVLAPPHSIPKTSSGKLRRSATRELYERGAIGSSEHAAIWQLMRLLGSAFIARVAATARAATALLYAAWWWLALVGVALVLWPLVVALPGRRRRWAAFRGGARCLFRLWALPVASEGTDRAIGPAVLVANHKSYLDGLLLAAVLHGETMFVAKRELRANPVARLLLEQLGAIFVDRFDRQRGAQDVRRIEQAVAAGARPLFFAEGTTRHPRGLAAFRLGAFLTAADAGLAVLPITIRGTDDVLPGHHWFPRHARLRVTIGAPLRPAGRTWHDALALRGATRRVILDALGEPDLASP
jgi:1-acyl-sn-glycerol-3-phosphate acyltransferase